MKLYKSALWIFLSILCVSGPFYLGFFIYQSYDRKRREDPKFIIRAILQTSSSAKSLPTQYLAEKMNLSVEASQNLFAFQEKKAQQQLQTSPWIERVSIKKILPNTLYIDYQLREPVATVYDLSDIGIDRKGFLFPPLFRDKYPSLYLGLKKVPEKIGEIPLQGEKLELAFQVMEEIYRYFPPAYQLIRIDVSKAFSSSYGKRELIILLEERRDIQVLGKTVACLFPKYLRVHVKQYSQQLKNFLSLNERMWQDYQRQLFLRPPESLSVSFQPKVFDLRIPNLAFVDREE